MGSWDWLVLKTHVQTSRHFQEKVTLLVSFSINISLISKLHGLWAGPHYQRLGTSLQV